MQVELKVSSFNHSTLLILSAQTESRELSGETKAPADHYFNDHHSSSNSKTCILSKTVQFQYNV